ncbi:MAG: ExeM/NucH family extracellular endonuclease, partial [Paracoccaceae bacterium]
EARLNEFHYDNAGTDTGEFIEVRTTAGGDASGLVVELYNGNGGAVYGSLTTASATVTTDGTYDYYVWDLASGGLQNGSPDGIALSNGGTLVEFLSYEGTFAGVGGAANGTTSTNIGVAEAGTEAPGLSLQRNEDGTWRAPEASTAGAANEGVVVPPTELLISEIQGSGSSSTRQGETVAVTAAVTYITTNGFYLQEEDADADADAATSEGIFVFTGGGVAVALGSIVSLVGTVAESFGQTAITGATDIVTVSTGARLPTAVTVTLDPATVQNFEAIEGMRVSVTSGTTDPLTVIENFNLDRFGEITIGAGNQTQPTQLFDAQTQAAEIAALTAANANARLLLDDGNTAQNPDEFEYLPANAGDNGNGFLDSGDNFSNDGATIRLGAELTAPVEGVLGFGFGEYRVFVGDQLEIDEATNGGARQDTPDDVGGTLQVASVNVLNYFSTLNDGTGGSGPNNLEPRGANTPEELARQTIKLVESITGTGAEVLALQEMENNGFGEGSGIDTLLDALNADALASGSCSVYAAVDPTDDGGFVGTDAIMAAIIYDSNAVTLTQSALLAYDEPSGAQTFALAQVLNPFVPVGLRVEDFDRNRPSVVATFTDNVTGESFTVVSSHFKSKGDSNLQDLADAAQTYLNGGGAGFAQADIDALRADPNFDQGDGQAFWNAVRLDAATQLADFMANDYQADGGYLLLGDFNSYAEDDPVQYLDDTAGLTDLIDTFIGQDEAYSFVFDGQRGTLDQGFASDDIAGFVTGATEWHINADEPDLISYDTSFKDPGFFNDGPYGAADHDPLIIGLDLGGGPLLV